MRWKLEEIGTGFDGGRRRRSRCGVTWVENNEVEGREGDGEEEDDEVVVEGRRRRTADKFVAMKI